MERIIVSVRRAGENQVRDLEISAEMPVEQLSVYVSQALGWNLNAAGQPVGYEVESYPPGRALQPFETLAQVQAWDGSWLIFHPVEPGVHGVSAIPGAGLGIGASRSTPSAVFKGPVSGWHSLEIPDGSPPPPETPQTPSRPDGFAWKQLDQ